MTAAPFDLDAKRLKHLEMLVAGMKSEPSYAAKAFNDAFLDAAPALFAAARERDKLRDALEAAETTLVYLDGYGRGQDHIRVALAKARAALGREGTP